MYWFSRRAWSLQNLSGWNSCWVWLQTARIFIALHDVTSSPKSNNSSTLQKAWKNSFFPFEDPSWKSVMRGSILINWRIKISFQNSPILSYSHPAFEGWGNAKKKSSSISSAFTKYSIIFIHISKVPKVVFFLLPCDFENSRVHTWLLI